MLILARHGESAWNADDRFAGQADVPLTEQGREEARAAGRWLRDQDLVPAYAHTSLLSRGIDTLEELAAACGFPDLPTRYDERLNERHYGALQGIPRAQAVKRFGVDQVSRWRRGIDDRPPLDDAGRGESLADVRTRLLPYVEHVLRPGLDRGHRILVVSHGNTLRMLRQLVEGLTDEEAATSDIPTGGVLVSRPAPTSRR